MHAPDQHRVLIVDDECIIADTLAAVFNLAGYRAEAAYSAEAALTLGASCPPHLAVLDIMLPDGNGLALAQGLQQRYPECRILLLSGSIAAADLLDTGRDAGQVWTTLPKPTPPAELLAKAGELLQSRVMP